MLGNSFNPIVTVFDVTPFTEICGTNRGSEQTEKENNVTESFNARSQEVTTLSYLH